VVVALTRAAPRDPTPNVDPKFRGAAAE